MDDKCEAAKMLMREALLRCKSIADRLPPECAMAALREVENYCHRRRIDIILTEPEECSCLLHIYAEGT